MQGRAFSTFDRLASFCQRVQEGKSLSDFVKMFEQTIKSKEETKKSKQKKVPDHHYTK